LVLNAGDTIDCFHFAIGEPSLAQEHTLAYIPGGFVEHDVFPPHTPDAALTHATEQWGRDLLDAHGTRLSESGVGRHTLVHAIMEHTILAALTRTQHVTT